MSRKYILVLLISSVCFFSCGDNTNKRLCKTWIFKEISTTGITVDMEKLSKESDFDMEDVYIEFDEDGDYEAVFPDRVTDENFNYKSKRKGEWRYNKESKTLTLKPNYGEKEKWKIKEISSNELVLEGDLSDKDATLTLIPLNED